MLMNATKGVDMSHLESNLKSVYEAARELVGSLGKLGAGWVVGSLDQTARELRRLTERLRNG
jgi:hypothetical protein